MSGVYKRLEPRKCAACQAIFTPGRQNGTYCSNACKLREWKKRGRTGSAEQARSERRECSAPGCKNLFTATAPHQRFCCEPCRERFHNRLRTKPGGTHKARARKYGVRFERFDKSDVFRRDGWRCRICGCECPEHLTGTNEANAPELDHVVPFAQGGEHTMANTQLACHTCNRAKGDGRPRVRGERYAGRTEAA